MRWASMPSCCSPPTRSGELNPAPIEGQGLNPLLQDPGLAFHPPTLYAAMSAVGRLFLRGRRAGDGAGRPGLCPCDAALGAGAWVLLTIGITAGSYWAYYELGWGGWWFWDPVENAR